MAFRAPVEKYKGRVVEVEIGKGDKAIKIGGENVLAFNQTFDEGEWPNPPKIAMEVWDRAPADGEWPESVLEPFKDVVSDPTAWAKKCEELGADAIFLYLISTSPSDKNTSPDEAAQTVKKVGEAVNIPLVVFASGDVEKDPDVLVKVAEVMSGENLLLGPAVKENFEPIANAAKEHGHAVVAQAPIDINLQKELDVKLARIIPREKIVLDPLAPSLGYGIEYGFSIFERSKQTGVTFEDEVMQMPILANFSFDSWKQKEAKEGSADLGIVWEVVTGITYLVAGGNLLVVRHPESLKILKEFIQEG